MIAAAAIVLGLLQLGLFLLLLAGAAHLLLGAWWAWRAGPLGPVAEAEPVTLPLVTVQLPMRNERYVAERLVRAVCAQRWPRERLQIHVLDDSDDETSALVDGLARAQREAGHDITVLRRGERGHGKAGNLAFGLGWARGEYVAVFDADCDPAPDALLGLLAPLVREPDLAFAQGRWSFLNQEHSLLTQVQALILHGLMLIEQPRLSAARLPLQFNGSGGVWRAAALRDAGGWLGADGGASIAEDLDLSYRARLRGHRGVSLPEVAVATELPETLAAFRVQQRRWVRGGAQVLRGLVLRLLRPRPGQELPAGERAAMLGHLARHLRQPWLVLLSLWLPLTVTGVLRPAFTLGLSWPRVLPVLWLAVGLYYGGALRRLPAAERPRLPYGHALLRAPLVLALSLSMSPSLTASLLGGLLGGAAPFVRTPKAGAQGAGGYRAPFDALALGEALMGLGYAGLLVWCLGHGQWLDAAGLLLPAAGYLWFGLGSLRR